MAGGPLFYGKCVRLEVYDVVQKHFSVFRIPDDDLGIVVVLPDAHEHAAARKFLNVVLSRMLYLLVYIVRRGAHGFVEISRRAKLVIVNLTVVSFDVLRVSGSRILLPGLSGDLDNTVSHTDAVRIILRYEFPDGVLFVRIGYAVQNVRVDHNDGLAPVSLFYRIPRPVRLGRVLSVHRRAEVRSVYSEAVAQLHLRLEHLAILVPRGESRPSELRYALPLHLKRSDRLGGAVRIRRTGRRLKSKLHASRTSRIRRKRILRPLDRISLVLYLIPSLRRDLRRKGEFFFQRLRKRLKRRVEILHAPRRVLDTRRLVRHLR